MLAAPAEVRSSAAAVSQASVLPILDSRIGLQTSRPETGSRPETASMTVDSSIIGLPSLAPPSGAAGERCGRHVGGGGSTSAASCHRDGRRTDAPGEHQAKSAMTFVIALFALLADLQGGLAARRNAPIKNESDEFAEFIIGRAFARPVG